MKNKKIKNIILMILGATALISAIFIYPCAYVVACAMIGFGTAAFSLSLIQLCSKSETRKANEIAENDERNLAIRGRASYAANITMLVALGILCVYYLQLDQFVIGMVFFGLILLLGLSHILAKAIYSGKM